MLNYKAIEVFTNEEARFRNAPITDAVLRFVRDQKIAARCIVTRGIGGLYENGELASHRIEVLSFNMPLRIYILLPEAELNRVLAPITDMVEDGLVAVHDLTMVSHRTRNAFIPRQILVRDAMTPSPVSVTADHPLVEAVPLLLSSMFTGLPVVDDRGRPIGLITQGDLIRRAGMPMRLGLLAETDQPEHAIMDAMAGRTAAQAMSRPVVTVSEDKRLAEAVNLMLDKGVKRLPVVDAGGRLSGMLSRIDVFRTVMRESPDWEAFKAQQVRVRPLGRVRDVVRRDALAVHPDDPIARVVQIIDKNDIQRVAVVDAEERLMGIIADRDLLRYFKDDPAGFRGLLASLGRRARGEAEAPAHERLQTATASDVMTPNPIRVTEDASLEEAIRVMTDKALKRLPVVDAEGRFKGMISRDSLLRSGFQSMRS